LHSRDKIRAGGAEINHDVDYIAAKAEHSVGGMICAWKKTSFQLVSSFAGEGFLGVKGV